MDYEWYDDVPANSSIEQGDIVECCNIIIPKEAHYLAISDNMETEEPFDIKEIDGIVLSQSCDIQNEKIDSIIICPIWSLRKFMNIGGSFAGSQARENLRQGKFPEYHLLQKFKGENLPDDFYYVDFHPIPSTNFIPVSTCSIIDLGTFESFSLKRSRSIA